MRKFFTRLTCLLFISALVLAFVWIYQDSRRVLAYRPLVQQTLISQNSPIDEDLILAMIYTESKGRGEDILQASESTTGQIGQITSPQASLQAGLDLLSQNLSLAVSKKTDTWTAIQAYNLGSSYIDYVAENGGKSSVTLARTFSREVVAPSLGNHTGSTYTYYHPLAILYGQPNLYQNGGNSYYAEQVKVNLVILKVMALIIKN